MQNSTLTRLLLWCGIAGPILIIISTIWASVLMPGYSHIANTVSQLASYGRQYPIIINIGFVLFGLLINGFAYGLYQVLGQGRVSSFFLIGTMVFGTFILLLAFFRDYNEASILPDEWEGQLHKIFAQISLIGLLSAMLFFVKATLSRPGWHVIACITIIAALAISVSSFAFLFLPASLQGLEQRIIYGISILWIVMASIKGLKRS